MLQIKQKHIILGLPIHLSWEIKSRYRFCLMFLPLSNWMFWRNWKLIATKGEKIIETHNENFLRSQKHLNIRLYKFRIFGLVLVESLEAELNNQYKEFNLKPIKSNEFRFQLEYLKFMCKSKMKVNLVDFNIQPIQFEIKTKVKSITFKCLKSEIKTIK
jgi:hypothetical protein